MNLATGMETGMETGMATGMGIGSAAPTLRPRLLLTEDEPLMRQAMARFFDARGYDVVGAGNLAESRRHLDSGRFDAFVVDVSLPDGDGLDLVSRVSPERAVVISADPQPERYARASVRHHLAKPLDLEILGRTVELVLASVAPAELRPAVPVSALRDRARPLTGFAARALGSRQLSDLADRSHQPPRAGDVVVVSVRSLGHCRRLLDPREQPVPLRPGDDLVAVLGGRYRPRAFEAEVRRLDCLQLLGSTGVVGTVVGRRPASPRLTEVGYVGHLVDGTGEPINLIDQLLEPAPLEGATPPLLLVAGAGPSSGRRRTVEALVRALSGRGLRVAAGRLTGHVSARRRRGLRAAGADPVRDFSDYGFASTWRTPAAELGSLFRRLLVDLREARPDLAILELAGDGPLQRESRLLLERPEVASRVGGVLVCAACPGSAVHAVDFIESLGHAVVGVSGRVADESLFARELAASSPAPVASGRGDAADLAALVMDSFAPGPAGRDPDVRFGRFARGSDTRSPCRLVRAGGCASRLASS